MLTTSKFKQTTVCVASFVVAMTEWMDRRYKRVAIKVFDTCVCIEGQIVNCLLSGYV